MPVETRIIETATIFDKEIAEKLKIDPDSQIVMLRRLRLLNGAPIALHTSYISKRLFTDKDIGRFKEVKSFYAVLDEKGVVPVTALEVYFILQIEDKDTCRLLGHQKDTPVFDIKRYTKDENGKIFEYTRSLFLSDRYFIEVELSSGKLK